MTSFEHDKSVALKRMQEYDRSNVGAVDEEIKELLDVINGLDDYYTTSSCAGRIVLMEIPLSGKKRDAQFILRSHQPISPDKVLEALHSYTGKEEVWFRQDPVILHIACRSVEAAMLLVNTLRPIGYKRCGIFSVQEERVMVEAIAVEFITVPVASQGMQHMPDTGLLKVIQRANEKLKSTQERIPLAESAISSMDSDKARKV